MDYFESLVEQKIRAAQLEGKFDALPGRGQPLRLEDNPFETPDCQLAYSLLKNNGFTLPWIEEGAELERETETLREKIKNTPSNDPALLQAAAALNRRILAFNLKVPAVEFQRALIKI